MYKKELLLEEIVRTYKTQNENKDDKVTDQDLHSFVNNIDNKVFKLWETLEKDPNVMKGRNEDSDEYYNLDLKSMEYENESQIETTKAKILNELQSQINQL